MFYLLSYVSLFLFYLSLQFISVFAVMCTLLLFLSYSLCLQSILSSTQFSHAIFKYYKFSLTKVH